MTSREVVSTAAAKAALFASSGAVAVDMESSVILAHAAAAGCPTLVVRGVSDAAGENVPLELIELMTPAGKLRPGARAGADGHAPAAAAARPGPAPGHPAGPRRGRAGARGARRLPAAVNVLVTGGTGFVGANLVRELLADGHTVRVLARPGGDRRALEGLRGGHRRGRSAGRRHLSARRWPGPATSTTWPPTTGSGRRTSQVLYRANVDGTRHLLAAASEAGAERIVYTSTVGAVGIPKDGTPGDETTPVSLADMVGAYKASKFLAERVADEWAARGAPVVIVNPSAPIGPWDVKPTPTGQMIVDFLNGKMVGSVDTGLNVVHVRDVARGHILAAEKGRVGERYILGHRNLSLLEIFQMLSTLTGVPAPRFRVPYAVAWMAAAAMEGVSRITRRPPAVPLTAVRMARKRMYFSAERPSASWACPRPRPRPPCRTRWLGSPPAAMRTPNGRGGVRHDLGYRAECEGANGTGGVRGPFLGPRI